MTQPTNTVGGLIRLRVDLAYDGTDFSGWAKQPGLRTVQGEILTALERIFDTDSEDFGLTVAGRTDAGVHAQAQVAHLDLSERQFARLGRHNQPTERLEKLAYRLNSLLPSDVRINELTEAPEGFDARFAATSRRYVYRIADRASVKDPLEARFTLWVNQELDLPKMQQAASLLIGLHDFAAFCKPREFSTTIRTLRFVDVRRVYGRGGVIEVDLLADAFCHNMVRSIVGALIAVGDGRAEPEDIRQRLDSASRSGSFKVVSPHGLSLTEIGYPPANQMAAQVAQAKALRSLEDEEVL